MQPNPSATNSRIVSIDLLRGIAVVIMAHDHLRGYFYAGTYLFDPTDMSQTTGPVFQSSQHLLQILITMTKHFSILSALFITLLLAGCNNADNSKPAAINDSTKTEVSDAPEYFNLRPKLEKEYGYTHAVKIGNHLKISGAVSMNDSGLIVAPGDMEQQMKNCYSDLEKILQHYGYTFDDVFAENVYTTNMAVFIKAAAFRNTIYKKQFPTGTWLEVKGLAVSGQLIEIDMEAHKAK